MKEFQMGAGLSAWSAFLGALVGGAVAIFVSISNWKVQKSLADEKIRVDKAYALIDEFFGNPMYEARRKIDEALKASDSEEIDAFKGTLKEVEKEYLAKLLHYFEKLEGALASGRVDVQLVRKTMSLKLSWWYVNLIERFQRSDNSEWTPLLKKLRNVRGACLDEDYKAYKKTAI
jgi:hypothetical protein